MQTFYCDPPFGTQLGVRNRPFQARFEQVVSEKPLGSQTSQQVKTGALYRATDGRSRREEHLKIAPDKPETENFVLIHDPNTQETYFLDVKLRASFRVPWSGESEDVVESPAVLSSAFLGDDIGQRLIEGLTCRGYYRMEPDGGVTEYWVSEELQEVLLAKNTSNDKESILRLFDIRRVEPDGDLFKVPADYKDSSSIESY